MHICCDSTTNGSKRATCYVSIYFLGRTHKYSSVWFGSDSADHRLRGDAGKAVEGRRTRRTFCPMIIPLCPPSSYSLVPTSANSARDRGIYCRQAIIRFNICNSNLNVLILCRIIWEVLFKYQWKMKNWIGKPIKNILERFYNLHRTIVCRINERSSRSKWAV